MASGWIKSADEQKRLRESGKRLAFVLSSVMQTVRPGMTTLELDKLAERLIVQSGGIPVFKGYGSETGNPFPASLCTSLNREVVHGVPGRKTVLQSGDVLKLDIGMRFAGMVSDMARTMLVGETGTPAAQRLITVTEESLKRGIAVLHPGAKLSDYAAAVQGYVENEGYSVVRDLVGHGVGYELHEPPQVPNFVSRDFQEITLAVGMTLALEPMVNAGSYPVKVDADGWTVVTADGSLSAHFEDTVIITKQGADVVTR